MPPSRYVQAPAPRPVDCRAELLAGIEELPPLPLVLNRVLQLLNDNNSSSSQIASLIEKDVVLSGSVMRCVNSAYYGLNATVSSIRHAVSLLGFSSVRNLALAFSMRRMLTTSHAPAPRLYSRYSQHSLSCALLCDHLVSFAPVANSDAAFASGLFHDIGKLLILTTFPDLLPRITELYESEHASYEEAEKEVVQVTHAEMSRVVMEKWQLPLWIQEAVEYHHRPEQSPHDTGGALSLGQIVHAADLYVNEYGLEILPSKRQTAQAADAAFEGIGLRGKLPEILEKFKSEFEGIRNLF